MYETDLLFMKEPALKMRKKEKKKKKKKKKERKKKEENRQAPGLQAAPGGLATAWPRRVLTHKGKKKRTEALQLHCGDTRLPEHRRWTGSGEGRVYVQVAGRVITKKVFSSSIKQVCSKRPASAYMSIIAGLVVL